MYVDLLDVHVIKNSVHLRNELFLIVVWKINQRWDQEEQKQGNVTPQATNLAECVFLMRIARLYANKKDLVVENAKASVENACALSLVDYS